MPRVRHVRERFPHACIVIGRKLNGMTPGELVSLLEHLAEASNRLRSMHAREGEVVSANTLTRRSAIEKECRRNAQYLQVSVNFGENDKQQGVYLYGRGLPNNDITGLGYGLDGLVE